MKTDQQAAVSRTSSWIDWLKSSIFGRTRRNRWTTAAAGLVLIASLSVAGYRVANPVETLPEEQFSRMLRDAEAGLVTKISTRPDFTHQTFEVFLKDGSKYRTTGPRIDVKDIREISAGGVEFIFESRATDFQGLPSYLMITLMLGFLGYTVFQGSGFTGLGGSKTANRSTTLFSDVAGNDEAKIAFEEVVRYLKDPTSFERLGAQFPKGVLMNGPPGTGKTLLARAVAGEAKANFLSVSGSEFSSMFVGASGMKVRSIFAKARRLAPCILFIDEIDAIGGKRLSEGSAAAREMSSTLNQLLVQLDGFAANTGVIVMAATNRLEMLDPALLRSGRFDRHVHLQLPNLREREAIMGLYCKGLTLGDFDLKEVARACTGMSGADLANLMNQAALIAVSEDSPAVTTLHGLQARDRLLMGDARRGHAADFDERLKRILAVHESGHAIIAMLRGRDPVTRVSIVPRGRSLGQTMITPAGEALLHDDETIQRQIQILLGGRAAEQLVLGISTTGAADDLNRASQLARDFVGVYGMGNKHLLRVDANSSQEWQSFVDNDANKNLVRAMRLCTEVLTEHRETFDWMVERLLETEELYEEQIAEAHAMIAAAQARLAQHEVRPVAIPAVVALT